MGWMGLDGVDGYQKCPLIFFILRYIKHYTHIYLYTLIVHIIATANYHDGFILLTVFPGGV